MPCKFSLVFLKSNAFSLRNYPFGWFLLKAKKRLWYERLMGNICPVSVHSPFSLPTENPRLCIQQIRCTCELCLTINAGIWSLSLSLSSPPPSPDKNFFAVLFSMLVFSLEIHGTILLVVSLLMAITSLIYINLVTGSSV